MSDFPGIYVPMVTPFKDGEVDYRSAQRLASYLVDSGVDGLVVCGTTGEASSLEPMEKNILLDAVFAGAGGRCPVVLGLSGCDTHKVAKEASHFDKSGVAGYLISAPYYVRPSQAGITMHFQKIAEATSLPIILYNIPSRTGVTIEIETVKALASTGRFPAIKECGGNMNRMMALLNYSSCKVLCGDDAQLFTLLMNGGHGAISASAHIRPDLFVEMARLIKHRHVNAAHHIFHRLMPLINVMFREPNPAPVKAALAMQGLIQEELRLPMLPASDDCRRQIETVLTDLDAIDTSHHPHGGKAYAA